MAAASSYHVFSDDALGHSDTIELAMRLRRRDVSVREVTEAAIRRAEKLSGEIPAYASQAFEMARDHADQMQVLLGNDNLFAGIPTFVKDNLPTRGFATGFGSAAIAPKIETKHDPYVRQFSELQFNILGKSRLPEFGFNASTEPSYGKATSNPWNRDYSAGASSGGAAALVATGAVTIAHGNDGGGSIRIPAACCGLVGLKPSRGRHVNSMAARALPINLVSEGVLTRSVRDTAYFHYLAETHYQNRKLPRLPLILRPGIRRLKIGLVSDSLSGQPTDPETRQTLDSTARLLTDMGHQVEPVPFPVSEAFSRDFPLYWALMAYIVKYSGRLALGKSFERQKLDDLTHGLARYYQKRAFKTPLAFYRLRKEAQRFINTFSRYDLLMSPVLSQTPARLSHLSPDVPFDELFERLKAYVGFTPMANVAGTPALSLPMGLSSKHLPIGLQFCANYGREDILLELAYELEEARPWKHLYQ